MIITIFFNFGYDFWYMLISILDNYAFTIHWKVLRHISALYSKCGVNVNFDQDRQSILRPKPLQPLSKCPTSCLQECKKEQLGIFQPHEISNHTDLYEILMCSAKTNLEWWKCNCCTKHDFYNLNLHGTVRCRIRSLC